MGKSSQTQTQTTTPLPGPRLNESIYPSITGKAEYISNRPDQANPFAHAANITGDENNAYEMIRQLMGKYQGVMDTGIAAQLDALERSGRAPTGEELQAYQNPFTEQVLNRTLERIQEQGDKNYRDIGSRSALSGAFGGSRQGLLEGLNAADTQRTMGDTYYSGMKDNYDQSLSTYLGQLDRLSNNAGRTLNAAGQGQQYGLTDAAALENIGLSQRQQQDKELGLQREEWANIYNEPYKELEALSMAAGALAPGDIGQRTTNTVTQSQNPLTSILGLASTLGGIFTGGATSGLSSILSSSGGGGRGWAEGGLVDPDNVVSSNPDKVAETIALLFSKGGKVSKKNK